MKKKIINGVDVSSCEELCSDAMHPSCYHLNSFCEDNPNCMFKQYAHKSAECEILKKKQNILIQGYIKRLKEWYNYKQALKEIKDLLFQIASADFDDEYERAYRDLQDNFRATQKQILQIINNIILSK